MAGSLRRTFAPPSTIPLPGAMEPRPAEVAGTIGPGTTSDRRSEPETPVGAGPQRFRNYAVYAAAAMLAVVGAVALSIWSEDRRPTPPDPSPDAMYGRLVAAGFTPQWKCENDAEFKKAVQDRLGQPLLLASGLPGVDVLGWAYADKGYDGSPLTGQAMILLTKADNQDVVVFIDQKKNDANPLTVRHKSGLHLFRREICDLVAYEVSPLSEPRIVQNLYDPGR